MTVNKAAPGTPKMLINIIVKKFIPMWKLKKLPIKLIRSISITPIKEFKKSLKINLSGNIKILHRTNIIQSPEM